MVGWAQFGVRSVACLGVTVSLFGCGGQEAPQAAPGAPPTSPPPPLSSAPPAPVLPDAAAEVDAGVGFDAGPIGSHFDGIKNLDETDVDCGGAGAPGCALGKACKMHGDCASSACRYDGVCIASKSCTAHNGGDTCGPNGTDDCCKALPVPRPGAPYVLDKFVITAGRFRQFVERTGGDLRGYIQTHRPPGWDPAWDAWLPNVLDDFTYDGKDGVYQQLGPGLYYPGEGGNYGCFVQGIGSRTYWLPPTINQARFQDAQTYDQATLDQKPLNCVTQPMLAAFCAWDGGHLPVIQELDYAWHGGDPANHYFPWGNTPRPLGWFDAYPSLADALSYGRTYCNPHGTGPCAEGYAAWRYNSWTPAVASTNDRSAYIPPPGRYPLGDGPFGHSDLAGLVFNHTATLSGSPGEDPNERLAQLSRNGSWQGHEVPFYELDTPGVYGWRMTAKYLATGGRCAR